VELSARDIAGVEDGFSLITERDLLEPPSFTVEDLRDFFAGSTSSWRGFGAGLPFERSYRSGKGKQFRDEVIDALTELAEDPGKPAARVIQLPCQGGSGATTLLRDAAFAAATAGFPSLVLKPDQTEFEPEIVLGFLGALSEASLARGLQDMPPSAIFFDVEHCATMDASCRQFCQLVAANGRRAVIVMARGLNAVEAEAGLSEERSDQRLRLKPLRSEIEGMDIEFVTDGWKRVVERWSLPVAVPSRQDWLAYEQATRWTGDDCAAPGDTLFWVGLSFVITTGMSLQDSDTIREALGEWVSRRARVCVSRYRVSRT